MRNLLFVLLLSCSPDQTGGGAGTVIGDGTATGTAASGTYDVESLTTSCSGTCAIVVNDFTISVCDVGTRIDNELEVRQSDGHLQIDSEDSEYISRMEGGLDSDGTFEVTGTRTAQGGAVTITIRSTGTITQGDGTTLIGSATGRVSGTVDGHTLNCNLVVDLDGERTGALPEQ